MSKTKVYTRYILLLLLLLLSFFVATASSEKVVVTGGRVVYDAFGRAVAIYLPTVDRLDVSVYSDTVDSEPPTVTEYDVLDRPVKVTYPDSTFTVTAYGVSGHVQVATVTDALGNESKTHVDGSGINMRQPARITGIEYRSIYLVINPKQKTRNN